MSLNIEKSICERWTSQTKAWAWARWSLTLSSIAHWRASICVIPLQEEMRWTWQPSSARRWLTVKPSRYVKVLMADKWILEHSKHTPTNLPFVILPLFHPGDGWAHTVWVTLSRIASITWQIFLHGYSWCFLRLTGWNQLQVDNVVKWCAESS
jgi:hypothetical protein